MTISSIGRSFNEIAQDRANRDPAFAGALLEEAVQCLIAGDVATARSLIRDTIKGTIGYEELSQRTGTPEKSLVRMFGPSGNPTADNLGSVLHELQEYGHFKLRVRSEQLVQNKIKRKPSASHGQHVV